MSTEDKLNSSNHNNEKLLLKNLLLVKDKILKKKLESLSIPDDMKVFARYSKNNLHIIGVESNEKISNKLILMAIPGSCHGNWSFIDLLKPLADNKIEIIILSLPGEGESKPINKNFNLISVNDYTKEVKNFLEELKKPVILLGHSFGGLLAQKLSAMAELNKIIKGLFLISSVPPSNLRYRDKKESGKIFSPKDNPKWIESLFSQDDKQNNDYKWWVDQLKSSKFPVNVVNNYGINKKGGLINPREIQVPVIELAGTKDMDSITNYILILVTLLNYFLAMLTERWVLLNFILKKVNVL